MDAFVADLLSAPGPPGGMTLLAGPVDARPAGGVRLVEGLPAVSGLPAGTVAVLTGPASRRAAGHRLDVALRDAAAAGCAGLVLTGGPVPEVARTARVIAERGRVALLHAKVPDVGGPASETAGAWEQEPEDRTGEQRGNERRGNEGAGGDLAALVIALARVIDGDAADALARLGAALDALLRTPADPRGAAAAVGAALGVPVEPRRPGPGEHGAVARGPQGEVAVAAPGATGHLGEAVRLAVRVTAETLARAVDEPAEDVPVRSRTLLLSELLVAPEGQALRLLGRARALGLPVDGWHIALRVEPAEAEGPERYALLDAAGRAALRSLMASGQGRWHQARADDALLLVRTQAGDPGRTGLRAAVKDAERLLAELGERFPAAGLRCGVGGAHQGPLGLRVSAREARTALERGGGGARTVTAHDLAGLDRMLGEWYASDTARSSARELLAPIEALGPQRAEPLLRTLQAYLDHQGSPARAAEELHLHRNAVTQRIRRAAGLLGVDLGDPEQRLALQLACRALHS
ncbi:hypothetical protein GCM10023085_18090 [Actinomadura viridis]|uniref:Sugar diacid utilization regulator n=1 Tax=Actinomadura viridis TaxID=58110 RepID=A0A931GR99_9ACTN|nr:helix-turn-helix domain-containing protein [Actinomadura viridis]MBG6089434.1 sugar diacid utilization regulator [Actinomadura viridis]